MTGFPDRAAWPVNPPPELLFPQEFIIGRNIHIAQDKCGLHCTSFVTLVTNQTCGVLANILNDGTDLCKQRLIVWSIGTVPRCNHSASIHGID
jgi:hypothetical protein